MNSSNEDNYADRVQNKCTSDCCDFLCKHLTLIFLAPDFHGVKGIFRLNVWIPTESGLYAQLMNDL
jgi:hypothetical protein